VAVLAHGEVSLYKIAKDNIKVKSMCLTITKELVLQTEPQVPRGTTTFPNDLLEIRGDRVGEPAEDVSIHPGLARVVGRALSDSMWSARAYLVRASNMLSCH
jgi:hypothetical protein